MSIDRIFFNNSEYPTIGVEVELQVLSRETLDLTPGASDILREFQHSENVKDELLKSIIEINTDICKNPDEVFSSLSNHISKANAVAYKSGYVLASLATHPFAKWEDQSVTNRKRYLSFLERMQWPLRRLLITGVHVHIGVDSGEKAIAVTNGLLKYIPLMIGLSANSPFFGGELTGLASTRTKIFEGLPTAGLPPVLRNFSEFQKLMRTLQRAKSIESIREVWWDIRPHPRFGTVEIRVFDSVPTIEHITALAALSQLLVIMLSEDYDNGLQQSLLDSWIIRENKWRATRYGIDAKIIVDNEGNEETLKNFIFKTLDDLEPLSIKLSSQNYINFLKKMINKDLIPYKVQKEIFNSSNDLKEILHSSINQLKVEKIYYD